MKVKLFTHSDLDGIGCAVVGRIAFDIIDIEYCDYHNVDKIVGEFVLEGGDYSYYDHVFITDISINEEVAGEIDKIEKSSVKTSITLFDHHPTALWLNKYNWATVVVEEKDGKCSGTSLFYDYVSHKLKDKPEVKEFVEKIRRYDTWEWNTKFNDNHAKQLNDLFWLIGREKFIERFVNYAVILFNDGEKLLLEVEQDKIDRYIKHKEKKMLVKNIRGYSVGVVFAEQYHSQLGNVLATNHPELAFIVIINMDLNKVSYRGVKNEIDLGKFANLYGGGGHPKSSGSQYESEIQDIVFDLIFNRTPKNLN